MSRRTLPGRDVEVDESGFLVDSLAWTPEIAEEMARESGLGALTPRHWRVVLCCREAAARAGHSPDLYSVVHLAGLPLRELDRLFRPHPLELMTKIAGLPKPLAWPE
jgi:dissimilatory sulfite reductase related protein